MQPQDDNVRELEVVYSNGVHQVLSNETRPAKEGELPKSWVLTDLEEVYWAKGDPAIFDGYGNYADHYVVKECQIYDAKTGLPGYHGETPFWRASIKLEAITSATSTTSTTVGQTTTIPTPTSNPEIVVTPTRPELITSVGSTPIPTITVTELPFTGPAFVGFLVTLALLCAGLGFLARAYYLNWIQKIEQDIKERADAKAKHPSRSLHNDESA
jgi:hypothetical protein